MTQAIGVPATAASGLLASGRGTLTGWVFREASGGGTGGYPAGASAAFAPAAAGSAALPAATDLLTGFAVTMTAVAAAVAGTVTVSNVVGGPYVYDFEGLVGAASVLAVTFPTPLTPSGGAPTVAISAIVGGGAGHIDVYGIVAASPAVARLHDGDAVNGRLLAVIDLHAGEQVSGDTGGDGADITAGLFLEVQSGTIEGVIYADLE